MVIEARRTLQPVIGLEVHAQLLTASKMFCGCDAHYADASPNSHVCAVCIGMPGSLPVINRRAVDMVISLALALHCDIPEISKFDRKNYSYPDIPKGYQISQYDRPLGEQGFLDYAVEGEVLRCGITRVHLEEDTGKSIHTVVGGKPVTLVDYNRSGVPLVEIVSEPDIPSPEAAREFFSALRQVVMYLGINDGNLQEGSLRADLNVSLRNPDGTLGTKVEIKNLNSFRAVQRGLEYEIQRQTEAIARREIIVQETRGWSERDEVTVGQRSKEYAHDYRYFPEPDLPPLVIQPSHVREIAAAVPEMPLPRTERLGREYGLSPSLAHVLAQERSLADYFEAGAAAAPELASTLANWVTGEILRLLNESGETIDQLRVSPEALARLVIMVEGRELSSTAGKQVLEAMVQTGEGPESVADRLDLRQIDDAATIEALVDRVLQANPRLVETYLNGKTNVLQAIVGKVMAESKGKANPVTVREILGRRLS